jgi:hypothetical protein
VKRADWHGRFSYLLALILFTLVLSSFVRGTEAGQIISRVLFSGILLVSVAVASQGRRPLAVAVGLGVLATVATWLHHFLPDRLWLVTVTHVLIVMVFVVTLAAILSHVLSRRRVTGETLSGAICAYLLIGLTGAFLYSVLEVFHPGSLKIAPEPPLDSAPPSNTYPHPGFSLLVYYSFVTLATVGYGDIIPVSSPARMLSVLEAIAGQLFLAVLIARLVGMHIASAGRGEGSP